MAYQTNKQLDEKVDDIRIRRKQPYGHILRDLDIMAEFLETVDKRQSGWEMLNGMYYMVTELINSYVFMRNGRDVGADPKRHKSRYIMQKLLELAKEDLEKQRARDAADERENG
jgi:hypothetical protein